MAPSKQPSRRDFLTGRAWIQALRGAAEEVAGALFSPKSPDISTLTISRYAMGTTFTVVLPAGISEATAAAMEALDIIQQLEDQLTVYHDRSEVAHVNRSAHHEPIAVSEELFQLLTLSAELYEATGGAFDPAAGALLDAWGLVHGPRRVPSSDELREALARSGFRWVKLQPSDRTVRFLRPGVKLNFGSIGKGFALDRAAEWIRARVPNVPGLIQGGASSVLAWGRSERRSWPVGIADPTRPGQRLATAWLKDQALGTASNLIQYFEHDGKRYGHVLDPRTGQPASAQLQVSVIAPDAATADALATALLVMGPEEAEEFCKRRDDVTVVMAFPDETGQVRVTALGPAVEESLDFNVENGVARP